MSETPIEITAEDDTTRHLFLAQVNFWAPNSGTVQVRARDEAHARELLPKLMSEVRDLQVIDIAKANDLMKDTAEVEMGNPPTASVN